jgi:hypothetical protein
MATDLLGLICQICAYPILDAVADVVGVSYRLPPEYFQLLSISSRFSAAFGLRMGPQLADYRQLAAAGLCALPLSGVCGSPSLLCSPTLFYVGSLDGDAMRLTCRRRR